jgi:hypothetical protein
VGRSSMRSVQEGEGGVEEGGGEGVVTREKSGVENTAASRQGVQERHLEPPPGLNTCINSQAILFVFFNCIMGLSSSGQEEGS